MNSTEIFTMALGLSEPWYVSKVEFIDGECSGKELHIWLNFRRGHRFRVGDKEGTAHDTIDKTWRHLNFFEHLCYLHASVPRIKTGEHETVMADVPWARKNSGFTLLFEAYSMLLIEREMPVNGVSRTVHETAPRIWRIFNHWVRKAVKKIDMSSVRHIGVDETSKRKGHNYITQFVDLDTRKTIFVTDGKDAGTFEAFSKALAERQGKVDNIKTVSMDMSKSFISGAMSQFPKASIIFDKFHIRKALNEIDGNRAMDSLKAEGRLTFNFDGNEVVLTKDDLLIDMAQTEGYVSEADNTVTVVLDTTLTPELLEEGFYREIVSKIQTMRKEAGFEVMDHIYVYVDKNEKIADLIKKYADELKSEVMADSITLGEMTGYTKEWNINGEDVVLGVAKVTK